MQVRVLWSGWVDNYVLLRLLGYWGLEDGSTVLQRLFLGLILFHIFVNNPEEVTVLIMFADDTKLESQCAQGQGYCLKGPQKLEGKGLQQPYEIW